LNAVLGLDFPVSAAGAVAAMLSGAVSARHPGGSARDAYSTGEKDAKVEKLSQLQPFLAVSPQECTGQLASFGPT
jgi:hypothetical protein